MSRFIEEWSGPFRRNKDAIGTAKPCSTGRGGGRFYVTVLVLMLMTVAVTVTLCMWFASTKGASGTGNTSSGASELPPTSDNTTSENPSTSDNPASEGSSSTGNATSSGNTSDYQMVLEAEQAFGANSIDKKHTAAMGETTTTQEMLSVYNDTLDAWRKQLNAMVTRLGTYTVEDQKALQSAWEKTAAEQIQEQETILGAQGGTIGQMELAEYTCMLYRQRGLELFIELYRYDRTYIF